MNKLKSTLIACFVAVLAFAGVGAMLGDTSEAASYNIRAQDCEPNSIIKCGAQSATQLKSEYNKNTYKDLPAVFAHYGVTAAMVNGMTQKQGYVTRNGDIYVGSTKVATGYTSVGRDNKVGAPIKINGKTYYQHHAGENWASGVQAIAAHVWLNADGQFVAGVLYSCGNPFTGHNVVEKPPVAKCNALKGAERLSRTEFRFAAPSTTAENGAKVISYNWNFGDGSKVVTSPAGKVTHTYAKAGTYKVTVTVNFSIKGKATTVSGANCATTVTVEEKAPVYACNTLTEPKKISRTERQFTAPSTTAENGAKVISYNWNFGDGSKVVTSPAGKVTHTYAKAGTYKVTVTVTFTVNGVEKTVTGNACATSVTIAPEMCDVPGKENYPKDSPLCVEEKPAVDIIKTVNNAEHAKVKVGTTFTYQITVKNTGNVELKNAVVTDKAPSQVTLVSASAGTIDGSTWTYTIPSLAVGASKSFTITAKYATYMSGTHKNTVCVDTPTVPGSPDDCDDATTETYDNTKVCDTKTDTIITVSIEDKDNAGYTTDLTQCEKVQVCDTNVTPPAVITVAKNDQNKPGYEDADSEKCHPTPVVPETPETPETPTTPTPVVETPTTTVVELPRTGIAGSLMSLIGAGSLVGVSLAYMTSRRNG